MDSDPEPEPTMPDTEGALDVDAEHERLDQLGERIEATRRQAEHDLHPGEGEQTFAESGDRKAETDDDQTIAPG